MRTAFGQTFGQSLSADSTQQPIFQNPFNSSLQLGGDFRASSRFIDTPQQDEQFLNQIDRASLYLHVKLLKQLELYIDQQLSPASDNRAAWVKYQSNDTSHYVRAGQFFLPFGLRLEDDSAFIRQVSGINFANPDTGIELGLESAQWSLQLALTNGTAASTENNNDKQVSFRLAYMQPVWRVGTSLNSNKSPSSKREMVNIFAMVNFLNAQWLIEIDQLKDRDIKSQTQQVFFAEVNKEIFKGHNLKLTYELHDPNTDIKQDQRTRNSLVWEYFPVAQLQLRSGLRFSEGIPQNPLVNSDEMFINLHAWF